MSGPKVVRIVTRDEIIDLCNGLLARVDAAFDEWLKVGQRNEFIDDDAITSTRRRRDALASLIASDRFMDFQKQAPLEVQFLRDDIQRRLVAAAAAKAAKRSKERRGKEALASLLIRLSELQVSIPSGLADRLRRAELDALSEAFRLLEKATPVSNDSIASASLAASMREGSGLRSFAEWLAQQPTQPLDPAIERIQARIDEMQDHFDTARWQTRILEIEDADEARRNLMLDALEVETARALMEHRRRRALVLDVRIQIAELSATDKDGKPAQSDLDELGVEALEALLSQTQVALTARREAAAAEARRTAVLEGLAKLGYQVTEGMTLASPQDGRLILRSTTRPDYGVEVSSAGLERMQMRAVAFTTDGGTADRARDRDAESIWCGEVSELRRDLSIVGTDLAIERSSPVGATPLKRVAIMGASETAVADVRAPQQRTLR
ncbi:hypothetical protein ACHMW7_09685 [Aminobacter sp. UC22_36]|uniref:hypothetical protein n=1 Tax=Aminobacter sp. UC22_36 TaxID=3374549 RepID=UPI0037566AA6